VVVGWLTFPGTDVVAKTGLDPSWVIGLNLFAHEGFRFGRDVIFTYGPLGWVVRPLDVGAHLLVGNWARVPLHLLLLGTALCLLLRGPRRRPVVLFLLALPLAVFFDRELDYEILGLAVLLITLAATRGPRWLLLIAAGLCAVLPFMKFGTGVCAFASLAWGLFLGRGRLPRRWLVATGLVLLLVFGVLARHLLGSLSGTGAFLLRSAQIASGYNAAMATVGDPAPIRAAGLLLAFLLLAIVGCGARTASGRLLLTSVVPVVYALKHSFVRQDVGHEVIVLGVLFWSGLAALLVSERRRELLWSGGLLVLTAFLSVASLSPEESAKRRTDLAEVLRGRRGTRHLAALVRPGPLRDELRRRAEVELASDVLPPSWKTAIGGAPVMVAPWEIALCLANALRCLPLPTLQLYSTYTPELDRWSAGRIREEQPEFILLGVGSVDERNTLWDSPETWEVMLRGWDVELRDPLRGLLLLKRRAAPREWGTVPLGSRTVDTREWVHLPERQGPLVVSLLLEERLGGKLERLLLRPRPVILEALTEAGHPHVHRLVVSTAREGLLLDAMPANVDQLAGLFDCCAVPERVRAFRLAGPGLGALRPRMTVVLSTLTTARGLVTEASSPAPEPLPVPGEPRLALDAVNGVPVGPGRARVTVHAALEAKASLTGWAVDCDAHAPVGAIILRIDGGRIERRAELGFLREDVARFFAEPGFALSGFRAPIPLDLLGPGSHRIELSVVSHDGRTVRSSGQTVEIEVRGP
jgi:hypothetical protein